jgi:K+-sensing histidine kinase KdpD
VLGLPPTAAGAALEDSRAITVRVRDVGHGMGLGLPVCHAIVAAHGGMLTTTSTPDKGSTFRVELPAADTHPGSIAPGARV